MKWKPLVLKCVRDLCENKKSNEFNLDEIYRYQNEMRKYYPENHTIDSVIRRTLQELRDEGLIIFLDNKGNYFLKKEFNVKNLDDLIPGQEYIRKELHGVFGGNQQKGIVTLPNYNCIFILNSMRGSDYGYSDKWSNGQYTLSGEGTLGDQKLTQSNKALVESIDNSRRIFLFEPSSRKPFTHIFEAELRCVDFKVEEGKDINGENRKMFRFFFKSLYHPDFRDSLLEQLKEEMKNKISIGTKRDKKIQNVNVREKISQDLGHKINVRDGFLCIYCDKNMISNFDNWKSIEIDHIVPVAETYDDSLVNLATSCNLCNSLKHSYVPENYETMTRDELISNIRKYVKGRRKIFNVEYQKVVENYSLFKKIKK